MNQTMYRGTMSSLMGTLKYHSLSCLHIIRIHNDYNYLKSHVHMYQSGTNMSIQSICDITLINIIQVCVFCM